MFIVYPSILLLVCLVPLSVFSLSLSSTDVSQAIKVLETFNNDYLTRISEGRINGISPQVVEFRRAQTLKKDGFMREKQLLKESIQIITQHADGIIFGIMTETGVKGLEVLRAWTTGLYLPRNVLIAVDEVTNREIELSSLNTKSVYVKYDSNKQGDAYMKQYHGEFSGVIFQPELSDKQFRQYGNLPISLFN